MAINYSHKSVVELERLGRVFIKRDQSCTMNQITLEKKPTHRLWAELVHGVAFLHLDVSKWNARVLRQMDSRWKEICESVKGSVYVCQNDMPTDRFLKRFGFVPDKDVNNIKIWRRDF